MTPYEFDTALMLTRADPGSASTKAARDSLVNGLTMYRSAKVNAVSETAVLKACRRILAAHALGECPTCHRPL